MEDTEKKQVQGLKLFVGGLPARIDQEAVQTFFAKYGPIADCQLKVNPRTKRSLGFAYLVVSQEETYQRLLTEQIYFESRLIEVKEFLDKSELDDKLVEDKQKKLFISGLPLDLQNKELVDYFNRFGEVSNAFIIKDNDTNQSKSYGYVKFEEAEAIDRVFEASDLKMRGQYLLEVERATNKQRISQKKHMIQEEKKKKAGGGALDKCSKKDKSKDSTASTTDMISCAGDSRVGKKSLKLSSPSVVFAPVHDPTQGTFISPVVSDSALEARNLYSPFAAPSSSGPISLLKHTIKNQSLQNVNEEDSQEKPKKEWLALSKALDERLENYGFKHSLYVPRRKTHRSLVLEQGQPQLF